MLCLLALAAAAKTGQLVVDLRTPAVHAGAPLGEQPGSPAVDPLPDAGAALEPAAGPADGPNEHAQDRPAPPEAADRRFPSGSGDLSRGELSVLEDLAARRRALEEQERALDLRRTLLETTEARLRDQLAELKQLKASIEAMISRHEAEEEGKLTRLVKIYETMKAKSAAEIFDRLDMKVLIEVVSRMREAKSSDILGRMDPVRARELTAELARRRELPAAQSQGRNGPGS